MCDTVASNGSPRNAGGDATDGPTGRLLRESVDEILRIDAPLIANRRITARPVTLAGVPLPTGARIRVLWASANRDERAPARDPAPVRAPYPAGGYRSAWVVLDRPA